MAIDDNTSYELTGAQVKDLANKIKAKAADNIFVGATSAAPGSKGLVPQPQASDDTKFLRGDGTWAAAGGGGRTTLYTDHSLGTYSVGDTIAIYKDKALTQQITTLAELGSIFDSSVVALEDNSKESWLFFYWYDDDAYNWSGPGYFWVRGSGGEEFVLCWDRYDGNVLKLYSTNSQQSTRSYSTSEAYTGESWIDGKSIYRKTIDIGTLPNATTKTVAHGISNLGLVIKAEGFASESSGVRMTFPFASVAAVGDQVAMRFEATNIVIITGVDCSSFSGYVTLYYTKSS